MNIHQCRCVLGVASVGAGLLVSTACSNEFSCEETRSCPSGKAGSGGMTNHDAGGAGASANAGASGAAQGDSGGGAPEGGSGNAPDTTPPTVISIVPENGKSGVVEDAVIVITFSEPMDKAITQAAYQSADVPAAQSVLTWSSDGRVLTVTPNADLAYAIGATPAVPARKYTLNVTTAAEDLAGNALEQDFTSSFSTLRRIKQAIASSDGVSLTPPGLYSYRCSAEGRLVIGENGDNLEYRGWLFFSIADLPSGITSLESAVLMATQVSVMGAPYGSGEDNLGNLILEHTSFAVVDASVHSAAPLRELGAFSTTADLEAKSASVLDAVKDDYANRISRKNQSQYRLRFAKATDGDGMADTASFNCGSGASLPTLTVGYLIP